MKKLPQLDMDSMEQEFGSLSDVEKAKYVGGVHYYDQIGQYLGKFGSSNELRILNESHEMNEVGGLSSTSPVNETLGSVFSQSANGIAKNTIIRKYLAASYEGPIYSIESYTTGGTLARFEGADFYYKANDAYFDDYNNLQNMMAHESFHWNNAHTTTPGLTEEQQWKNEEQAILHARYHSSYNGTTSAYKWNLRNYLWETWRKMKKAGLEDGYKLEDLDRIFN